jgi:hypothetical protein
MVSFYQVCCTIKPKMGIYSLNHAFCVLDDLWLLPNLWLLPIWVVPMARCVALGVKMLQLRHWFITLHGRPKHMVGYLSYGPPWAHYLGGYQDRLLGGPLGLLGLCHMTPDGMRRKDYGGEVL